MKRTKIQAQWGKILELLPKDWENKCRELKVFQRGRGISNVEELLRLNILHVTEGGSFNSTSAITKLGDSANLNKTATYNRIKKSWPWLKWLCKNICRNAGLITEQPEWLKGKRTIIVDGSDESIKGSNKTDYKIHYAIELFKLECLQFQLTDNKTGETLTNFEVEKNDLFIGDRAYGTITGMEHVRNAGGDFLLRLKTNPFTLYCEDGTKLNLLKEIQSLSLNEWKCESIFAYYKIKEELKPIRICVMKKDEKEYEKALKKMKRKRCKNQLGDISDDALEFNKYIIITTSLNEDVTTECVFNLYRMRWAIELVFKRLKSIFGLGEMPVKNEESVKSWFYGRLLIAIIAETLVNNGRFSP